LNEFGFFFEKGITRPLHQIDAHSHRMNLDVVS
jgi:hypothetical protein